MEAYKPRGLRLTDILGGLLGARFQRDRQALIRGASTGSQIVAILENIHFHI